MRIVTTKTTVAALLATLEGADPAEEVVFAKASKREPGPCWCGCGGTTKSRFVPGHDSRFHGEAKRVARGEADREAALAALPHDEAKAEFERHVALEEPKHEAREAAKRAEKAEKARVKAEAKAAKEKDGEAEEEVAGEDAILSYFDKLEVAEAS